MASFGGKLRITIGANVSEAEKALKDLSKRVSSFGKQLTSFGKDFSVSISAPLTAWGAASVSAGLKVREALNDVAVGTGATGEALDGLKADFKALAGQVPDDMSLSAKAIADLNTLLGVSGKDLQEMAKAFLNLSRITKTDLGSNINLMSKMMSNWGITAARTTEILDKLLIASQNTGVSMADLAKNLTENGTALRTLGFNFEESVALLASMSKAGVETGKVMTGLQRALGNLAGQGVKDMGSAFAGLIDEIKNAPDMAQAVRLAGEAFGKLVDTQMAAAIREGNFELRDFVAILNNAEGTLNFFVDEAEGFSENWGRITNQFTLALEPLGTRILKIAQEYMPELSSAIETVTIDFSDTTVKIGMLAAALGPATLTLGAFTAAVSALINSIKILYGVLAGPVGIVVALGLASTAIGNYFTSLQDAENETEKTRIVVDLLGESFENVSVESLEAKLVSLQGALIETRKQAALAAQQILELSSQRASARAGIFGGNALGEYARQTQKDNIQIQAYEDAIKQIDERLESLRAEKPVTNTQVKTGKSKGYSVGKGGKSSKSSGKSALDLFIENVQDRIKYFKEDGTIFLEKIQTMQSKLKPLSEDWKKLEDLRLNIDTTSFEKSLQNIRDQIKYLDKDGSEFLPQLQEMSKNFEPLSDKGKQIADIMKSITEEIYSKKWSIYSWEFSEGLLKASEYAELLKAEISGLTEGTEKWRARFSELQNVKVSEISKVLENLSREFQTGKIQTEGYESALNTIIQEFSEFPRVVQIATEALESFRSQNELITLSTGQQLTNALEDATKDFKELQGQGILRVTEGFLQAGIYGQDFGESLKKLGQDIVYTTLKMVILAQLTKWLSSAFGNSFGGVGALPLSLNAKGNVFQNGYKLTAYAKGGLVNKPTMFSMSDGLGLMGEAGTEAIMPLTRDGSGRLGVYAQIQGNTNSKAPTVIINVENRSGYQLTAEQSGVSFDEQFNKAVVQVVLRDQAINGPITRNFRRR